MTFNSNNDPSHLYFITASLCGWKKLFIEEEYANIVLTSMTWLRSHNRFSLYAFVLMPTHLHAIIKPINQTIGEILQFFGSYTAHAILKKLRIDNRSELIQLFQQKRRDNSRTLSIWQDIQAKNIYSREFLIQKLEYIHNNPINKEWQLVANREDYPYSSACFYDAGDKPIIEVDDIRVWL